MASAIRGLPSHFFCTSVVLRGEGGGSAEDFDPKSRFPIIYSLVITEVLSEMSFVVMPLDEKLATIGYLIQSFGTS